MSSYSDDLWDFINEPPKPKRTSGRRFTLIELLAVFGVIAILFVLLWPATQIARPAHGPAHCVDHLKQIALALYNYESTYKVLPPAYTVDADGKPLHSWRTLILPYLEQTSLYETIDLSKPWNDPANAKAFATNIQTYQCPELRLADNKTTYLAVVGLNGCFPPGKCRHVPADIASRGSTLMVIEASSDQAVPWMAPTDADETLVMGLGPRSKLSHRHGTNAAFLDGRIRHLKASTPATERRAMISIPGTDDRIER